MTVYFGPAGASASFYAEGTNLPGDAGMAVKARAERF